MSKRYFVGVFVLFFCLQSANSQSLVIPAQGYKNTFGTAVSSGVFLNKDAVFWGLSVDYSRLFSKRWIYNISFSYDQEHSKSNEGEKSIVNTLTPSLAIGYALKQNIALGLGLGKGLFDDDNENKTVKYNKDGGWTVGLIGVFTFYQKGPHGFDVSVGLEQGLSNPETDVTVELGYGLSF